MDFQETEDKKDLRVILKPLFFVMKLFGLYYTPEIVKQTTQQNVPEKDVLGIRKVKNILLNNIWKGYAIFMLMMVWIIVVRSVVAMFWKYDDTEFKFQWSTYAVVMMGYNLQSALEVSLLFRMFHRRDRYHKFLVDWYEFSIEADACGCPQDKLALQLRKVFLRYFVSFLIIFILLQVGLLVGLFGQDCATKESVIQFVDPLPRTGIFYVFTAICVMLIQTPWICTILLFVATSKALALQFKTLTIGLDKTIMESPNTYPPFLPALRLTHLKLCDFVSLIERDFKLILAVAYCLNILISLFLGYKMVKSDFQVGPFLMRGFWLVCNISKVYILSLCASQLHDTAQEPMASLFKVNPRGITLDQSKNVSENSISIMSFGFLQLDLFISKLQGTSIGFTVCDFMLVRRETILTLIGVFLTYFFILVQFNIP